LIRARSQAKKLQFNFIIRDLFMKNQRSIFIKMCSTLLLVSCTALSFSSAAQPKRVAATGDSRYFFTTLYAQAPEMAKKVAITAAMCGFPVTQETAMKLMGKDESSRVGNNSTELSDKCGVLLTPGRTNTGSAQRSTPNVVPETMLMQAMSGSLGGGSPDSNPSYSAPRVNGASTSPQSYATPPGPNGTKRELEGVNGWSGYVRALHRATPALPHSKLA
jgi:hypothetical protein